MSTGISDGVAGWPNAGEEAKGREREGERKGEKGDRKWPLGAGKAKPGCERFFFLFFFSLSFPPTLSNVADVCFPL